MTSVEIELFENVLKSFQIYVNKLKSDVLIQEIENSKNSVKVKSLHTTNNLHPKKIPCDKTFVNNKLFNDDCDDYDDYDDCDDDCDDDDKSITQFLLPLIKILSFAKKNRKRSKSEHLPKNKNGKLYKSNNLDVPTIPILKTPIYENNSSINKNCDKNEIKHENSELNTNQQMTDTFDAHMDQQDMVWDRINKSREKLMEENIMDEDFTNDYSVNPSNNQEQPQNSDHMKSDMVVNEVNPTYKKYPSLNKLSQYSKSNADQEMYKIFKRAEQNIHQLVRIDESLKNNMGDLIQDEADRLLKLYVSS
jgi:hypothetical protein